MQRTRSNAYMLFLFCKEDVLVARALSQLCLRASLCSNHQSELTYISAPEASDREET